MLHRSRTPLLYHIQEHHAHLAQHCVEDGKNPGLAADSLRDALAGVGINNAGRVADAITRQGADAYITPSGAVLTLLTKLAEEGDIVTFARTYALFAKVHRANSRFVRDSVPAKILSTYLTGHLRLGARGAMAWAKRTTGWQTELKAALSDPGLFVATVDRMAAQIRTTG